EDGRRFEYKFKGPNAALRSSIVNVFYKTRCSGKFCITVYREITAEAGLCVVIPCSFKTSYDFTPQNMVWLQCEPSERKCTESDIIFHPDEGKVQSGFKGRVSLLEPDVSQRNCSIIINDLTESDSGSYQLRLIGRSYYGKQDGFSFPLRATVSVKGMKMMVPSMADGQQTTLTCAAPGLCPGSDPKITWTWTGAGEKASDITGNNIASKSETLNAVIQRHSSTLTFNSSVELHGTSVTCTVSFTNNIITEETVTLNVTCECPLAISELLVFTMSLVFRQEFSDNNNDTVNNLPEESGISTYSINNVTAKDSGQYICTAKHLNKTLMKTVDVNVICKYTSNVVCQCCCVLEGCLNPPPDIVEGKTVTLTCSAKGNPLPTFTWFKNKSMSSELHTKTNYFLLDGPRRTNISSSVNVSGVKAGYRLTLFCNTDANPAPMTYSWYRYSNNKLIEPSQWKSKTTNDSKLSFEHVQRTDEACYMCNATNIIRIGENSRPVCITVQCK
uniref:Ig-like domain-containing protein n=1 Tax=Mola mola TaxID=94237 RepID=A0A3Q4BHN7_MOLML